MVCVDASSGQKNTLRIQQQDLLSLLPLIFMGPFDFRRPIFPSRTPVRGLVGSISLLRIFLYTSWAVETNARSTFVPNFALASMKRSPCSRAKSSPAQKKSEYNEN